MKCVYNITENDNHFKFKYKDTNETIKEIIYESSFLVLLPIVIDLIDSF